MAGREERAPDMRAYSQTDEENLRDQALVEDWIRSGLLNPDQEQTFRSGMTVRLRQTQSVLRAVLALFTLLIVVASVGLTVILLDIPLFGIWGAICLGLAWLLATRGRLYRCGAEEALAAAAVVLLTLSLTETRPSEFRGLFGMVAGTLGSFGIYALFRFRYALATGAVLAGLTPFMLRESVVTERSLSLLVFALIFFGARLIQHLTPREAANEDWTVAQAAAFAGFYLVLNLMISTRGMGLLGPSDTSVSVKWFYWLTYVLTWTVPATGLWLGVRERVRLVMDVSAAAFLVTILTNKAYLGRTHQTWDPILLGILLIAAAVSLRRWLAKEPDGFTPRRLLESENRAISAAAALSLAVPQAPGPNAPEPQSFKGSGGQSGGGGASGNF
jgi:hypothetical protein